jgi:hypothetical protein
MRGIHALILMSLRRFCQNGRHLKSGITNFSGILHHIARVRKQKTLNLDSLQLDKLSLRRKKLKTNLMFKIPKGHTPSYLQNLFSLRGTRYNFRNSEVKLNLPKPRTNFLKRSPSYSGARLWNSLPQDIRMIPLLS